MIFDIIKELQNKKVRVIAIKNNFDLNPQKKNDITAQVLMFAFGLSAQVLMFAFGLSAQIERDLISERTKQGLIVAKSKVKLRKYQRKIMRDYKSGMSINAIAIKYHVTWVTAKRFITIYAKMKKPAPLTEKPQKHGHPTYAELEYFKTHI